MILLGFYNFYDCSNCSTLVSQFTQIILFCLLFLVFAKHLSYTHTEWQQQRLMLVNGSITDFQVWAFVSQ